MYLPSHFEEKRTEMLHGLMRTHPFGTLVTLSSGALNANHIPFELDAGDGPFGLLRAHVARGNPVWKDHSDEVDALVVFQGAHSYISPSWYPGKEKDGRAVPTWNYMTVHAYGPLRVIEDKAWLRAQVERLSNRHEAGRANPWKLGDAPADYIEKMLGAIIGIEIPITKCIGKWKVSQNQPEANRAGVQRGLLDAGDDNAVAMAQAVMEAVK
ncbi:MAG TPA: FMN-binding negative transcriptional regulator [Noviherbaspirillum sp.]|uniref:FMN-binding negative transcriptional regulator n=1 Tax=Noviherbaspirillum sp. TaxID=1926288 RepID=UPI002D478E30|nr:FMN-binding negative transcriptional regulator [Noviherbaspirillum sp.]HYD97208.1 FMN-binding negative transcriptional regulator [Noviherbaspirillum sp.]